KTSKVEKEFYLRCSYLTLSVLFDKEPKKELTVPTLALCADDDNKTYRKRIVSSQTQTEKN
ncbi:hypothetical protein LC961_11605, partial [Enterococcus faecium]|nr:hypothetical protein [Enterococcus faecium]